MLQHLVDVEAARDVAVQHAADQVDALFTHGKGDTQVAIHDLVDAVEGVLLVDDGVQKNAKCPDVLLCTTIWLASKNFRSSII